jgi:hypothetical protein
MKMKVIGGINVSRKIDYDRKVAACADYLLGMSSKDLEFKHRIDASLIANWIRKRKCFKLKKKIIKKNNLK